MKFALGQAVPRTEDPRLLTGRGRYTDDFVLPRLAHAHVLRSPHAYARIRLIDILAAQQMPDVLAVLTGEDWAAEKFGARARSFRGSAATARRCSCRRARRSRRTVRCSSATPSPLSSPRASISPRTRPSGLRSSTSRFPPSPQRKRRCHRARRSSGRNAMTTNASSLRSATSAPSRRASPRLITLAASSSSSTASPPRRWSRAAALASGTIGSAGSRFMSGPSARTPRAPTWRAASCTSETQLRVVAGEVGGSFGMKGGHYPEYALALWASRKLGRPVKWIAERGEGMLRDDHDRDHISEAELALDRDGHFLALRARNISNIGAYLAPGGII